MTRRRTPRLAVGVAWSIALTACDHPRVAGDDHVDTLAALAARSEMRIGDTDDPSVGFSRVRGVDVDRDGNVYVLEASVPEIRVYNPAGALLRRIGRRGAGPGEFESAPRFGVVGDTVWALTYGPDRITLFDRNGTLLSARRAERVVVPLPRAYGYVVAWTLRPDGKFMSHMWGVGLSRDDPPSGVQPTDSIPVPFVLFDPTGAVTDTIGWAGRPPPRLWSPPEPGEQARDLIEARGRRYFVPRPPPTSPWWEPLSDGYLLVEASPAASELDGAFAVTRFGLSGDTVYRRTLHYRPVPYLAAELDSIAARAARGEAGGMVPYSPSRRSAPPDDWEMIARSLRAAMSFPEFKPPIEWPWVAQDETLWLRLPGEEASSARWVLLDARGRPRGMLELDSRIRIVWSRGDTCWAVEPDEYDVPWLVRFRIEPG